MADPRKRTKELIDRLESNGIDYLVDLINNILSKQNKGSAMDDASAYVITKPVNQT